MFVKRFFTLSAALLLLASTSLFAVQEENIPTTGQGAWTRWAEPTGVQYYDDLIIYMHGENAMAWGTFDVSNSPIGDSDISVHNAMLKVFFETPENWPAERPCDNWTITAGPLTEDITDPETQRENTAFLSHGTFSTDSFWTDSERNLLFVVMDIGRNAPMLSAVQAAAAGDGVISFGMQGGYEPNTDPLEIHHIELSAITYPTIESATISNVTANSAGLFTFDVTSNNTTFDPENPLYIYIDAKCDAFNNGEYAYSHYFYNNLTQDIGSQSINISAQDLLGSDELIGGEYTFRITTFTNTETIQGIRGEWNEYATAYELGADEDIATALPTTTEICGAYPNPFNGMTTINFQLHKASNVSMKLYDIQGRLVSELMNQQMTAGAHVQSLELSNLTSGTYFVRMEANDNVSVEKIMLLK